MLLSILPLVGASLVWAPTAIYLAVTGELLKALIIVVVGGLVIGLVDNILRPLLVGRDTKMPDYLILLSTLGGLTVFGISGFVIGPGDSGPLPVGLGDVPAGEHAVCP